MRAWITFSLSKKILQIIVQIRTR